VRLELEEHETQAGRLSLSLYCRVLTFSNLLSNDEKRGFADALRATLRVPRGAQV
jgi:hypothetical protein